MQVVGDDPKCASPCNRGADGLSGIALTVGLRDEYPTDFRCVFEGRLQVPLVISESGFSDKFACGLFLYHPISEAEQGPMANVTQQSGPRLFVGEGLAANEPGYGWVRPHCRASSEIVKPMAPEFEALCLEDGYCSSGKGHL